MDLTRRSAVIYVLLAALWLLVAGWQVQEHLRVKGSAKAELRDKSKEIANTLCALLRGIRFRGGIPKDRLELALNELVQTNALVKSSRLLSVVLLNAAGSNVVEVGNHVDLEQKDIVQEGERWGLRTVTLINPIDLGAALNSETTTNPTVVFPAPNQIPRHEPKPEETIGSNSLTSGIQPPPPPAERERRRRPPWLRG